MLPVLPANHFSFSNQVGRGQLRRQNVATPQCGKAAKPKQNLHALKNVVASHRVMMYMYRRRNFYTSVTRYLLFELFFNVSIHFKQKMGVVAPSRISDILTKCKKCIIQKLSHLKHTWGTKRCGSVWLFIRHLDILHFEVFFQYWWHFMNLICILSYFCPGA